VLNTHTKNFQHLYYDKPLAPPPQFGLAQLTQAWSMYSRTPPCNSFLALCSTPLPWLPVLANIEPPALRRKAATDRLVTKVLSHDSWPLSGRRHSAATWFHFPRQQWSLKDCNSIITTVNRFKRCAQLARC